MIETIAFIEMSVCILSSFVSLAFTQFKWA